MSPGLSQALLAKLTGQTYAQTVQRHVFTPLSMQHASMSPDIKVGDTGLPGGFKADGHTPIPYWHMTFPAYGALNAPLADMQKLITAIFSSQPKQVSAMQQRHLFHGESSLAGREGFQFTYASGLYPRVRAGRVWWGHGGDADGYRSRMAFLRDQQRGYLAVINTDNPGALRQIEHTIERHISDMLPSPEPALSRTASLSQLQELTGTFYPATARFDTRRWQAGEHAPATVTLLANAAGLRFSRRDRHIKLYPTGTVGGRQFRRAHDPTSTVVFVATPTDLYMQGELGNFVRTHQ